MAVSKHEQNQLRLLLEGSRYDGLAVPFNDPPDGLACCRGVPCAAIEHTEYLPDDSGHGGSPMKRNASFWWEQLWPVLDRERRERTWLANWFVAFEFRVGHTVPKSDACGRFIALLDEVPALLGDRFGQVDRIWLKPRMDCAHLSVFPSAEHRWACFDGEVTIHLNSTDTADFGTILMSRFNPASVSVPWPEWWGSDMVGPVSLDPATFRRILDKKNPKVASIHDRYPDLSAWLVIECDHQGFALSGIFPRVADDATEDDVISEFRNCGFDFATLQFDEVWLMPDGISEVFCLYPPNRAGCRKLE